MVKLTTVFEFTVKVRDAVPVFSTKDGNSVLIYVESAKAVSLDEERFPIDIDFSFGYDNIFNAADGSYSNLDCKVYGKTQKGHGVVFNYSGVVKTEGITGKLMTSKEPGEMSYEEGYITANFNFDIDDRAMPEVGWLKLYNVVGKGKFKRDETGQLWVSYLGHIIE
jgi:hypothetical protein